MADDGSAVDAACDDEYMDDAQPRDDEGYDGEVRDVQVDDDAASATGHGAPAASRAANTPARHGQRPSEHHIGTPGTTRSRTTRGGTPARAADLAPPPMFYSVPNEPTIRDIMAAIASGKQETLARIDELAGGQAAQEEALTRLDARTTKLYETATALRAGTDRLAERISALSALPS